MKGSLMNRYRRKKLNWPQFVPWFFAVLSFLFLYYQIRTVSIPIRIEPEVEEAQITKDPCIELRTQIDSERRTIVGLQQRLAAFQADIAMKIELSKTGQIPAVELMQILKKHDATYRKIYQKLYSVEPKKK
jgi:hypothetical protein